MKLRLWSCAVVVSMLAAPCGPAFAEAPRSVFCIAVRTVPKLDQDNFVMGAMGPVYTTANFQTDLPADELASRWKAYIRARHPVGFPENPDDTCYPANSRRAVMDAQQGDIRRISVDWTPAKDATGSKGN